jgi:hypothetical protein
VTRVSTRCLDGRLDSNQRYLCSAERIHCLNLAHCITSARLMGATTRVDEIVCVLPLELPTRVGQDSNLQHQN